MNKRLKLLGAISALAFAASPSLAQEAPTADTVVATVNGTGITLGHMAVVRAQLPENYQDVPDETLFDGILEQIVGQQALAQEISGGTPKDIQLGLENLERAELAGLALNTFLEEAVTENDIQAAYNTQFKDWQPATEYNASHILVATEEDANAIKTQLDDGSDFAEIAKEKSTGPSGPSGGNLGWFGEGTMVPEFETAVLALAVGEVSDPVQTQFGWHVIKMNEMRKTEQPGLDVVRQQLVEQLRQQKASEFIETVTDKAEVILPAEGEFDPAILKELDLSGN